MEIKALGSPCTTTLDNVTDRQIILEINNRIIQDIIFMELLNIWFRHKGKTLSDEDELSEKWKHTVSSSQSEFTEKNILQKKFAEVDLFRNVFIFR